MTESKTTPKQYGRRHEARGLRQGNAVRIVCSFSAWAFDYVNEKAARRNISFSACLRELVEETIEVDLECSLDAMGLHEVADMIELQVKFARVP